MLSRFWGYVQRVFHLNLALFTALGAAGSAGAPVQTQYAPIVVHTFIQQAEGVRQAYEKAASAPPTPSRHDSSETPKSLNAFLENQEASRRWSDNSSRLLLLMTQLLNLTDNLGDNRYLKEKLLDLLDSVRNLFGELVSNDEFIENMDKLAEAVAKMDEDKMKRKENCEKINNMIDAALVYTVAPTPPSGRTSETPKSSVKSVVAIDDFLWNIGYTAGLTGQSMPRMPGDNLSLDDSLRLSSGYLDGKADNAKPPSQRRYRRRGAVQ